MTLRYKVRIGTLLKDHDKARTVFERETKHLEDEIKRKCTNSFITGAIIMTIVLAGVLYVSHQQGYDKFSLVPYVKGV
jgi:hypothetical protein